MVRKHISKHQVAWWGMFVLLVVLLAACNSGNPGGQTSNKPATHKAVTPNATTVVTSSTPNSNTSKPSNGPIVITSPTPVPGGNANSQQIILPDRTIVINSITKQNSTTKNAVSIVMALTIKDTGGKDITNQSSYYQLISSEGDAFGLTQAEISAAANFFGTITAGNARTGTLNFEVPSATVSNLRLLYRSNIATETVFVVLHV